MGDGEGLDKDESAASIRVLYFLFKFLVLAFNTICSISIISVFSASASNGLVLLPCEASQTICYYILLSSLNQPSSYFLSSCWLSFTVFLLRNKFPVLPGFYQTHNLGLTYFNLFSLSSLSLSFSPLVGMCDLFLDISKLRSSSCV